MDRKGHVLLDTYRDPRGRWVFDDYELDPPLLEEAWVSGMDQVMDLLHDRVKTDADPEPRFNVYLGLEPPEGSTNAIELVHHQTLTHPILGKSHYYWCAALDRKVWLCHNLHRYVEVAPEKLYLEATRH